MSNWRCQIEKSATGWERQYSMCDINDNGGRHSGVAKGFPVWQSRVSQTVDVTWGQSQVQHKQTGEDQVWEVKFENILLLIFHNYLPLQVYFPWGTYNFNAELMSSRPPRWRYSSPISRLGRSDGDTQWLSMSPLGLVFDLCKVLQFPRLHAQCC